MNAKGDCGWEVERNNKSFERIIQSPVCKICNSEETFKSVKVQHLLSLTDIISREPCDSCWSLISEGQR